MGDVGTELFFLRIGKVAVLVVPKWGGDEIAELSSGSYFGEVALLTGRRRASWVMAKSYSIVSVLDKQVVDGISENYPGAFVLLVKSMRTVCKLEPQTTWKAISEYLGEAFENSADAFMWICKLDPKCCNLLNEELYITAYGF